jgi:thymidylate synthase
MQADQEYLKLCQYILDNGTRQSNRTGVDTLSVFGYQCRYDLRLGFPLLTTKKVNFEAIKAELFWFLQGSSNVNELPEEFRFMWDAWADKETGSTNGIYGHQWTQHSNYVPLNPMSPYFKVNKPINQLDDILKRLHKDPTDRRLIVSAWNVPEVPTMCLPPCHVLFHVKVYGDNLDLLMYQRSLDTPIGGPYNVASYALLQHMIASEVGLKPRFFIHSIGDAHIYVNQIDGIQEQLKREPFTSPRLELDDDISFWEMRSSDLRLHNYEYHPFIKFPVAV